MSPSPATTINAPFSKEDRPTQDSESLRTSAKRRASDPSSPSGKKKAKRDSTGRKSLGSQGQSDGSPSKENDAPQKGSGGVNPAVHAKQKKSSRASLSNKNANPPNAPSDTPSDTPSNTPSNTHSHVSHDTPGPLAVMVDEEAKESTSSSQAEGDTSLGATKDSEPSTASSRNNRLGPVEIEAYLDSLGLGISTATGGVTESPKLSRPALASSNIRPSPAETKAALAHIEKEEKNGGQGEEASDPVDTIDADDDELHHRKEEDEDGVHVEEPADDSDGHESADDPIFPGDSDSNPGGDSEPDYDEYH
ncbi:hypothetical protein CYLTODRAFT_447268 [Cylindrobasidium torrendii FP15055 ss-10]|uniref:Uncharacterized protein n=1 Tax=Cylindrobasidium torrendii FP15055 ss-10 TaxID=1314674 RepID=A0A0D7AVB8_9AGAR|nr:hypothetical protein CYLTODRAFT_447268 [Cylindrobasidium torrendii FP15055 ss-10]